jgi:hypothetical protein
MDFHGFKACDLGPMVSRRRDAYTLEEECRKTHLVELLWKLLEGSEFEHALQAFRKGLFGPSAFKPSNCQTMDTKSA